MNEVELRALDYENGTDADFDTYAVEVQNGDGYYDDAGSFHYFHSWLADD